MTHGIQRIRVEISRYDGSSIKRNCLSGILCSPKFGHETSGLYPAVVSQVLLATPMSFMVLMAHQRIQEALSNKDFDGIYSFGLAMAYYHGPGAKRFLGLRLHNYDKDYLPAALPGITANDFPALARQEERLFFLAQAALTDPDQPVSRLLLLASNDITTDGVENLPTDLYKRLIHYLLITKRLPLEIIKHIEISDEKQEVNQGGVIVISTATLEAEPHHANLRLKDISAAPLIATAN